MFVMHDGELVGDEQPGGLCLQAIPSGKGGDDQANNRGASSMNRIKSNNLTSSMQLETLELYQFKNNKVVPSITITQS